MNVAKAKAGSQARKEAMAADEAKLMAAQLEKVQVTIQVKIGEGGKLFGSVTGKDVSDALKQSHIDIDKRKISIKGEVTGEGVYEAVIKVHPTITSTVKVNVVAG
jgi:large subunit ribosomal protein L9